MFSSIITKVSIAYIESWHSFKLKFYLPKSYLDEGIIKLGQFSVRKSIQLSNFPTLGGMRLYIGAQMCHVIQSLSPIGCCSCVSCLLFAQTPRSRHPADLDRQPWTQKNISHLMGPYIYHRENIISSLYPPSVNQKD